MFSDSLMLVLATTPAGEVVGGTVEVVAAVAVTTGGARVGVAESVLIVCSKQGCCAAIERPWMRSLVAATIRPWRLRRCGER